MPWAHHKRPAGAIRTRVLVPSRTVFVPCHQFSYSSPLGESHMSRSWDGDHRRFSPFSFKPRCPLICSSPILPLSRPFSSPHPTSVSALVSAPAQEPSSRWSSSFSSFYLLTLKARIRSFSLKWFILVFYDLSMKSLGERGDHKRSIQELKSPGS